MRLCSAIFGFVSYERATLKLRYTYNSLAIVWREWMRYIAAWRFVLHKAELRHALLDQLVDAQVLFQIIDEEVLTNRSAYIHSATE